jgi:hypothetical protein
VNPKRGEWEGWERKRKRKRKTRTILTSYGTRNVHVVFK